MKIRKCINEEIPELDNAITLLVYTKAPRKGVLIDTETLDIYKGSNNSETGKQWTKIKNISNVQEFKKNIFQNRF